jgi:hypothetical protein
MEMFSPLSCLCRRRRRKKLPEPGEVDSSTPIPKSFLVEGVPPRKATLGTAAATSDSPLFKRIPPETRRRILIQAFGERPMHFDLRLMHPPSKHQPQPKTYPPRKLGPPPPPPWRHANIRGAMDESKPLQWQWRSSVCHRLSPGIQPAEPVRYASSGRDWCFRGSGYRCEDWPGEGPAKCCIGATGWLRTCRQAYVEGAEVLYGTNQFCIEGT